MITIFEDKGLLDVAQIHAPLRAERYMERLDSAFAAALRA